MQVSIWCCKIQWNSHLELEHAQNNQTMSSSSKKNCSFPTFRYCNQEQLVRVEKTLATLKDCTVSRNIAKGKKVHADAVESGDMKDLYVANSVINMYARCGDLSEAHKVFDSMTSRSASSWTVMMFGYAENGKPEVALELFQRMLSQGMKPDARTFVAALQACTKLAEQEDGKLFNEKVKALEKGMVIHSEAAKAGLDRDMFVGNTLVNMYAKCGSMVEAGRSFDRLSCYNVVSWTSLLMGHAENGEGELVLRLFSNMHSSCSPNARTYVAAFKACSNMAAEEAEVDGKTLRLRTLEYGMFMHWQAVKLGFDVDVYLASSVVDMYARCGSLMDARAAFDRLRKRDVVCWNVLMLRYAENGDVESALELYTQMHEADSLSCVAALKACTILAAREESSEMDGKLIKLESLEKGMAIHSRAERLGFGDDLFLANSTLDMYGKCGSTEDARRKFDALSSKTLVSWNALMLGYAENGEGELGLELLSRMLLQKNCLPDGRTYAAALKSCGSVVDLEAGKELHARICCCGYETDPVLVTCLLDLYGKCGSFVNAQLVFDSAQARVLETWTSLMAGYSRLGDTEHVFAIFQMMLEEGMKPDGITFVCLLTVCSHAGLVARGKMYFEAMVSKFGISPCMEHYHCMIDILGRANEMDAALAMLKRMPFKPNLWSWMTLLGACVKWNNVLVGKIAFEEVVRIDDKDCGSYMLMAALYRSAGMTEEQSEVEAMKVNARARDKPRRRNGWTDAAGIVHKFIMD